MGPVLKKLLSKIPFAVASGKTLPVAVTAASDAAVALYPTAAAAAVAAFPPIVPAGLTDGEKSALYVAGNTARELRAILLERGLTVTLGNTKAEDADLIVADGGDGTNTAAEDARAADYELYFAELLATLQAEATQRSITFADPGDDVEDLTILLITDDVTNSTTFDVS